MDIFHLKNSELDSKFDQHSGRVALRCDTVTDDTGSYAVFTEQGSSASQMTAAKVMDVTARVSGCAGQAADAVSPYTQVKMEDAPSSLKISKSECPDIWIRLPKHKWPKSWSSMEDPVVPLEICTVILLARQLWEKQLDNVLLEHGWDKVPSWKHLFVNREKRTILVCVRGRYQTGWKETKHWPNVESTHERRWFERTDIIPCQCLMGLYSQRMSD